MEIRANAKLNWTLDITGRRADGYHLLDMLMQPISLCDTLRIEEADSLTLSVLHDETLSAESDKLALGAARALQAAARCDKGARITLDKAIPTGAGLGGGSADAAAVLVALNALWDLRLSEKELRRIGLTLGADVPFCVAGRPMRVRGVGEKLSPITVGRRFELVLVKPCAGLSTRDVFAKADAFAPLHSDTPGAIDALALGDLRLLSGCAANALYPAALSLRPRLADAAAALSQTGARFVSMTGSGAVVYGAYMTRAEADDAADELGRSDYPAVLRAHTLTKKDAL